MWGDECVKYLDSGNFFTRVVISNHHNLPFE